LDARPLTGTLTGTDPDPDPASTVGVVELKFVADVPYSK
jgi:hypothetical protein